MTFFFNEEQLPLQSEKFWNKNNLPLFSEVLNTTS